MKLQKFLAQAGVASRRSAESLITSGVVKVNGVTMKELGAVVDAERDRVEVEGRRVSLAAKVYRLMLKPRECLATLDNSKRPTLARFVKDLEPGVHVVAPLDYPAEGVLLLTNDGDLAEAMSRPGAPLPMTYHLKFQGLVGDQEIATLLKGWFWERRRIVPKVAEVIATTGKNTWVQLVVAESRPRALKAGGERIRRPILKVSRVALGGLSFVGLKMGEFRDLKKAEAEGLRRAVGVVGAKPL